MIESAFVIEKTCFGLPNTDLGAFGECPRFHLYSFQGPSLWYLCSSGKSSYSIEILQNFAQKSSNHLFSMNKLSFDHWWYTAERFLELACASHILPLLLCAWIFESLKIVMKSLETLHKWSNQSSLLKKPDLDYQAEILVFLESVLDFTYIAFKGLLCGIFAHPESHHVDLKSFGTLPKSPNYWLLMKKLSFDHLWYTSEMFLEFTVSSNILPLLLFPQFLKVWKLLWNHLKVCTNDRISLRYWKNLLWITQHKS